MRHKIVMGFIGAVCLLVGAAAFYFHSSVKGVVFLALSMLFFGECREQKSRTRFPLPTPGSRCNLCGELYTGIAGDCRCTNYGR